MCLIVAMDFDKCLEILNNRQSQHEHKSGEHECDGKSAVTSSCPCLASLTNVQQRSSVNDKVNEEENESEVMYDKMESLELLEKFTRLQSERVVVSVSRY